MNRICIFLRILWGMGNSIYINFKILPFSKAIRFPILVSFNTQLRGISKETIKIDALKIHLGMINIGILEQSEGIIGPQKTYFGTDGASKIIFRDDFSMVYGGCLKAINGGVLMIGDKVTFNRHSKALCSYKTTIGDNVLLDWNVTLKDGDGHPINDEEGK